MGLKGMCSMKKKPAIVAGVVLAIVVVAGAGFWIWHEQPSFCGAICHDPMGPYLATYEEEPSAGAVDKYGNEVDGSSMQAAVHRVKADAACLTCHEPTLSQQVGEGAAWVTGNYATPLAERSLSDLTSASGKSGKEFCSNDECHAFSDKVFLALADDYDLNPHDFYHGDVECSDCHKAHTQSVLQCSRCHDDAEVPEGWLDWSDYENLVG